MNVIKILNNVKQKVKISKEDIEQAMKTCSTREQLANYFGVSLSTIKRRLKEFNLSTFKPFIHSDCLYKLHPESF